MKNRGQIYLPPWKRPKIGGKYLKQWILNTELQAAQESDSWEKGNRWSAPHNCPSLLPARRKFPGHVTGRGKPGRTGNLHVRRQSWESMEAKETWYFCRAKYQGGDSYTEESVRDLPRLACYSIWVLVSTRVWGKYPRPGSRATELTQGSHRPDGKPHIHRHKAELSQGFVSAVIKN